jgi:hypothetical protein
MCKCWLNGFYFHIFLVEQIRHVTYAMQSYLDKYQWIPLLIIEN